MTSLREQALRGGAYLAVRQGISLFISLGGVLLLTRLIGPASYGLYAGSLGIVSVLTLIGRLGINVFLIRCPEPPDQHMYNQATTLLLLSGLALALGGVALPPLFAGRLLSPDFVPPLQVMAAVSPIALVTMPALAKLERDLNYRAVALIELAGQIAHYTVSLPLAALGAGVWSPVAGHVTWQVLLLVWVYRASGLRPRPTWSRVLVAEMLRFGVGQTTSVGVRRLRDLINPLVVGHFFGPEGVGYVALAIRFGEVLSFFREVSGRVSIAVLAKVQDDYSRLRRGVEEAMTLQVLAVGPFLCGFSLVAIPLVPLLFGARWEPALEVYPFIALGMLVNTVFNVQASALYALGRNGDVTLCYLVHVVLFVLGAWIMVPRVGFIGYGLSEVLALGGYAVLHFRISRLFAFSYREVMPWLVAMIPPLFALHFEPGARLLFWLPLIVVALLPHQRQMIAQYLGYVRTWRLT
ncbi:oligosaccharide flippase family protein [Sphaerobacter thermophilus]|uniref:oligosaccharide flippase family protein n=1 Tax=Sphaerobacter thermophilus TaxID=2057 RepID=UPI000DB8E4BA|nr:MAG: polysaccharide biosynthesis protein [Sphaerobacter thermophilus]